jgi:hypothetical protein
MPKRIHSTDIIIAFIIAAILLVGFVAFLGSPSPAIGQQADQPRPSAFGQLNAALSAAAPEGPRADPRAAVELPGPKTGAAGVPLPAAQVDVWFAIRVADRTEYVRWSQVQGFIPARDAGGAGGGSVRTAILHSGGHSVGVLRAADDLVPAMVTAVNAAYLSAARGALLPVVVIDIDGGPVDPAAGGAD